MMDIPTFQPGDVFLVDSHRTGAKIVKFFQTAPTWVQHIWRKIRGTQEKVLFYHVGMMYDKFNIIEQQSKVIKRDNTKLLNTNNELLVIRKIGITKQEQERLIEVAEKDLGERYDVLNIFGKLFTWLTGIPLFAMFMQFPNQDICINRVAYWHKEALGDKFGGSTHSILTTHMLYKYILSRPDVYKIVYRGNPRADKLS